MTKIDIYLNKGVEENASIYFERSKKAKKKIEGAEEAIKKFKKKLDKLRKDKEKIIEKKKKKVKKTKKEWFEKYRWFYSSDNFLVIGGRDSTTNEIIIKKHTDKNDLVFHTDMAGSPFVVIKSDSKEIPEQTKKEAAQFTAAFSKAWKTNLTFTKVYYVKPEQVTKEAKAGEYLQKGAFMVYGKKEYYSPKITLAIGLSEEKGNKIMSGPESAIKKHCKNYFIIKQGDEKPSDVAKKINKKFNTDLDEIIRALPPGNCKIKN